ncbi:MAG: hypothetical protein JJU21_09685 [Salinarimonas sp.]|nr:hypothetical protein [Salinarimonas sp.]
MAIRENAARNLRAADYGQGARHASPRRSARIAKTIGTHRQDDRVCDRACPHCRIFGLLAGTCHAQQLILLKKKPRIAASRLT